MAKKPLLYNLIREMLAGTHDNTLELKSDDWELPYLTATLLSMGKIPKETWPEAVEKLIEAAKKTCNQCVHGAIGKALQSLNGVGRLRSVVKAAKDEDKELGNLQILLEIIETPEEEKE